MNHYETVFIMTPVLSEDQVKETVKGYISYLKDNKAEIVSEEAKAHVVPPSDVFSSLIYPSLLRLNL